MLLADNLVADNNMYINKSPKSVVMECGPGIGVQNAVKQTS